MIVCKAVVVTDTRVLQRVFFRRTAENRKVLSLFFNTDHIMSKQREIKTRRKKDKESLQERIKALEIAAAKEIVDQMFVIMDGIEGAIYVADMETYELLHVNSYIRKHFGNNLVGKKCYKMLHNQQDRPCAFCTNKQLFTNGKAVPPLIRATEQAFGISIATGLS